MNLLYTLALTSVYIYNSLGQYLSVGADGKPAISDKPVAMEVSRQQRLHLKTPIAGILAAKTSNGY